MTDQVVQDDAVPPKPHVRPRIALLASVAVALLIALGELDSLLGQILDASGRVWSVNGLQGPTVLFHAADTAKGWSFFDGLTNTPGVPGREWLIAHVVVDWGLAAVYSLLGWHWFMAHRTTPEGSTVPDRLRDVHWKKWGEPTAGDIGTVFVLVGAAFDALEGVGILLGNPLGLLVWLTSLKWVCLFVAIGCFLSCAKRSLRRLPRALYTHRYSAAIVLPLTALSIGRGPDLLEQIPDIQRSWAESLGGFLDFLAAGFTMVLLGGAAFLIGRQRTGYLWLRTCPLWHGAEHQCPVVDGVDQCPVARRRTAEPQPLPLLRLWFLGPAVFLAAAVVLAVLGAPVDPVPLAIFCGIPLVIGGISYVLRRWVWKGGQEHRYHRAPISLAQYTTASLVGDALVGMLPLIAGLGVIRAFVGPVALFGLSDAATWLVLAALLSIGASWPALYVAQVWLDSWAHTRPADLRATSFRERVLVQLTPGMSMVRGTRELDDPDLPMSDRVSRFVRGFATQRSAWTVLGVSGILMVLIACLPVALADNLGVVATFQLALGSLSVLVAAAVILFQPGGSPEVFWRFKIPFAPITTLLVLACVLSALAGADDVHRIRTYPDPATATTPAQRPTLDGLFRTWLDEGADCEQELAGTRDLRIRPLLMYAAEGGGIRAAYWTTSAIDLIATSSEGTGDLIDPICQSAFLSSGASGGSVGLSIASVRDVGTAGDAVDDIAGPEALGAASDGLVLRDTIYAATGLPLPSWRDPGTTDLDWSDRATLIEQAWERAIPRLRSPFLKRLGTWRRDWPSTGALVLNSTSPTTSCRTLISQINFPGSGAGSCGTDSPAAGSADLAVCTKQMRTTTAALLTARFPYVTPSGIVTCPGTEPTEPGEVPEDRDIQVVDGGYAENTGVGTLVDLMPRIMARVRRHNDCVLAEPRPKSCAGERAGNTLVVPQLVYFDNGTGSDLVDRPGGPALEPLVPPLTILGAKGALYSARAQLERAYSLLTTDQLWSVHTSYDDEATAAVSALRGKPDNPVAVVLQKTRPGIAAPLGWSLSGFSMDAMDKALCDQEDVAQLDFGASRTTGTGTATPAAAEPSEPEFATIDDVLAMVGSGSGECRS